MGAETLIMLLGAIGSVLLFRAILWIANALFKGVVNDHKSPTVDILTDYPGGVLFYVTSPKLLNWDRLKYAWSVNNYKVTELATVHYGTFNHKRLYRWNIDAEIVCKLDNELLARDVAKEALLFYVEYH